MSSKIRFTSIIWPCIFTSFLMLPRVLSYSYICRYMYSIDFLLSSKSSFSFQEGKRDAEILPLIWEAGGSQPVKLAIFLNATFHFSISYKCITEHRWHLKVLPSWPKNFRWTALQPQTACQKSSPEPSSLQKNLEIKWKIFYSSNTFLPFWFINISSREPLQMLRFSTL